MEELYLPVLSHFQNGNVWTASAGKLRYRAAGGETIAAEVWQGPWNLELAEIEEKREFPLTEEGIDQLRAWLLTWAEEMNARHEETLEQTLERRDARVHSAEQQAQQTN